VLRLARFAAELAEYGFRIAPETEQLATRMSTAPELLSLSPGRVWREMKRALQSRYPEVFLRCLARFGALHRLMPWLTAAQDPDGPACALECAAALTGVPEVRLAAALVAAARHGATAVAPPEWPLPASVRDLSDTVLQQPLPDTRDAMEVLSWLEGVDAWRRGERFGQLLTIWRSICPGKEQELTRLDQARVASLKVPPPGKVKDPRATVRAARLRLVRRALDSDATGNAS
jgi:tRNA nucleotidyltransferase (CCA-adding enzyme)